MKKQSDIIEFILRDHKPLKQLIEILKDTNIERSKKEALYEEFVPLLLAHAKAEENSLYMQMKYIIGLRRQGYEGDTEHSIAEKLINEINGAADDDVWSAKVKVLAELVEHHIEEEEKEMLVRIEEQMHPDIRRGVGVLYAEIKNEMETLNRPLRRMEQNPMEQRMH